MLFSDYLEGKTFALNTCLQNMLLGMREDYTNNIYLNDELSENYMIV